MLLMAVKTLLQESPHLILPVGIQYPVLQYYVYCLVQGQAAHWSKAHPPPKQKLICHDKYNYTVHKYNYTVHKQCPLYFSHKFL